MTAQHTYMYGHNNRLTPLHAPSEYTDTASNLLSSEASRPIRLGADLRTAHAMPLTIKPPQPPTCDFRPQLHNVQQISTSVDSHNSVQARAPSPVAPDVSPITPKSHPVLPAALPQQTGTETAVNPSIQPSLHNGETSTTTVAPSQYVPAPPPPQPFSSDDSTDGLALRAAISSLQFQRQQARDDIKSLQEIKKQALAEPERFTQELVAGRVKEKRHDFGSAQDVVDARDEAKQPSSDATEALMNAVDMDTSERRADPAIVTLPGPQNIVRMPHINWDKYNILGEPLEALHEQQRKHPGSAPFQQNKGREFSVTAPYSPFHDAMVGPSHTRNTSDGSRQDSTSNSVISTPVTTEHPYETRRSSKQQAQ